MCLAQTLGKCDIKLARFLAMAPHFGIRVWHSVFAIRHSFSAIRHPASCQPFLPPSRFSILNGEAGTSKTGSKGSIGPSDILREFRRLLTQLPVKLPQLRFPNFRFAFSKPDRILWRLGVRAAGRRGFERCYTMLQNRNKMLHPHKFCIGGSRGGARYSPWNHQRMNPPTNQATQPPINS